MKFYYKVSGVDFEVDLGGVQDADDHGKWYFHLEALCNDLRINYKWQRDSLIASNLVRGFKLQKDGVEFGRSVAHVTEETILNLLHTMTKNGNLKVFSKLSESTRIKVDAYLNSKPNIAEVLNLFTNPKTIDNGPPLVLPATPKFGEPAFRKDARDWGMGPLQISHAVRNGYTEVVAEGGPKGFTTYERKWRMETYQAGQYKHIKTTPLSVFEQQRPDHELSQRSVEYNVESIDLDDSGKWVRTILDKVVEEKPWDKDVSFVNLKGEMYV